MLYIELFKLKFNSEMDEKILQLEFYELLIDFGYPQLKCWNFKGNSRVRIEASSWGNDRKLLRG